MAFSGLSTHELFAASQLQEDISKLVIALSPKETPFLDFLGDSDIFASNIKHEYIEDFMLPNVISTSTAINSAASGTAIAIAINGLGNALTVKTLLQNRSAAPETYQVSSIVGADSIVLTRAYDGSAVGSLAVGGTLYVQAHAGVEGQDHSGLDTRRLGNRLANTVGYYKIELAQSGTADRVSQLGNNSWEGRRAKALVDMMKSLEREVINGKWNVANTLGTSSTTRTMRGVRSQLTSVNSTINSASFVANPHLYIGNLMEQVYNNGASVNTETWGLVAGPAWYRAISDLNDTKVVDSSEKEDFKRLIRRYTGPFGSAEVFLSRDLTGAEASGAVAGAELLLVAKERLKVVPLQGGSIQEIDIATQGDNRKSMMIAEFTSELHHQAAMARATGSTSF